MKLNIKRIKAQVSEWISCDQFKDGGLPMRLQLPFQAKIVRSAYGGVSEDQCVLSFTPSNHEGDPQWEYRASFKILNNELAVPYLGNGTIPATLFFDPHGELIPEVRWVPGNQIRILLLDKRWRHLSFDHDGYQAVGLQFLHIDNECLWPIWKLKLWQLWMRYIRFRN